MPSSSNNSDGKFTKIDDQIEERLLKARRIFYSEAVDQDSAKKLIRKLWYLELSDPGKPILLILNCPGGAVNAGLAIWDQIKMLTSPVTTLVTGLAASMGSVLSLVAPKGRRFVTPNARIMIHQPAIHGVIQGQATDLEIQAKEIMRTKAALVKIYCEATGRDEKTIEKALDRDNWMNPQEAMEFGLIDKIVKNYQEVGV